jgi:serine/threonine-protein kinase 19
MSRKRSLFQNHVLQKKSKLTSTEPEQNWADDDIKFDALGNDTNSTLLYLKRLFPVEAFERRLPPVILQHQLYAILHNRTIVDKQVDELRQAGVIRVFRLGVEENTTCIVFTDDYKAHALRFADEQGLERHLLVRFLSTAVTQCHDVNFSKQKLATFLFSDSDITQLVKAGVLTVRDVGSWWLAIPSAGLFTKSLAYGRRALQALIRRCKYHEILRQELETKKLPKAAKLGMAYHIHDLIGSDVVESVSTTSGPLLRLRG